VLQTEGSNGIIPFLVAYHFDFDSTNGIARCRLEGVISDQEVNDCYQDCADYVARTSPRAGVLDLSAVTFLNATPQTVRNLAALVPALPDPSRTRCIIAPSDHVFGMARLFEIEGEHTRPNLHVIRTAEEAWAILSVRKPHFNTHQEPAKNRKTSA